MQRRTESKRGSNLGPLDYESRYLATEPSEHQYFLNFYNRSQKNDREGH